MEVAQQKYIDQAKNLVLKLVVDECVCVYLFGSRATQQFGKYSDIDIALLPKTQMPAGLVNRLKLAFEESKIPYSVDIVDLSKTDDQFRNRVLAEGVLWKDWKND